MSIPDFQTFMLPVLRIAGEGETYIHDARNRIAKEFGFSDDELAKMLPGGGRTIFVDRVYWAVTYLKHAGLVERPMRGYFIATVEGRKLLQSPPEKIDKNFLNQYPAFQKFLTPTATDNTPKQTNVHEAPAAVESGTPEERADAALGEWNNQVREELLQLIRDMHPTRFEKLILDLMLGMGYGGGGGEHVGRTADGGIDGVINEDALGLDIICLQAKRYKKGRVISSELVRGFAGALDGKGATKGVFVTTSHFSRNARAYADTITKRLILIDGQELADLLMKHDVAVRTYRELAFKRIDMDYFKDADE